MFLVGLDAGVDDLESLTTRGRVKDEDNAIDQLGHQVTFKLFVYHDQVHVGVGD